MVKRPKKTNKSLTNTINSILPEKSQRLSASLKSKQQIDKEYYQKNKQKKKAQQKLNYAKKKEKEQKQLNKYYQASNIKVLMSFKEYIGLNKDKKKL